MTIPTLNRLRELKLGGMAHALQQQQEQPGPYAELSFTERLAMLVEQEHLYREQKKQSRLLQQAHLKLSATLQEIDYQHPRNVERNQIAQLAQSEWINRGQNLLITGPCGSGKTYLACAFGHNACLHGYSVRISAIAIACFGIIRSLLFLTYSFTLTDRNPLFFSLIHPLIRSDGCCEPIDPVTHPLPLDFRSCCTIH